MEKELIISNIRTPLLRAGRANLNIFILVIFLIFGYQIINYFQIFFIGGIVYTIGICYILRIYFTSAVRISFCKNEIIFVTPCRFIYLQVDQIKSVKINALSINPHIDLKIELKNKFIPKFFNFTAMDTSFGGFKETMSTIEEIFKNYNIPIKKSVDILAYLKNKL